MNVYVGMDVHKKSWSVTILTDDMEYRTFEFPLFDNLLPRPAAMIKHCISFFNSHLLLKLILMES